MPVSTSIRNKLAIYSILLIIVTTLSSALGAVWVISRQAQQDNQQRLHHALRYFQKEFSRLVSDTETNVQNFTQESVRTSRFASALLFDSGSNELPVEFGMLAKSIEAENAAFYFQTDQETVNTLKYTYQRSLNGVSVPYGISSCYSPTHRHCLFLLPPAQEQEERFVEEFDLFPLTYSPELPPYGLRHQNHQVRLVVRQEYRNTVLEDPALNLRKGQNIGYFWLELDLTGILASLGESLGVEFGIYDLQGQLGESVVPLAKLSASQLQQTGMFRLEDEHQQSYDSLLIPLHQGPHPLGYLVAFISRESTFRKMQETIGVMLAIAGVILLLTVFVSVTLVERWSRPIRRLARLCSEVANGQQQLSTIPTGSQDELGTLIQAFNEMVSSVKKAQTRALHLLESERDIASAHDVFTVMVKAANAMIRQLLVTQAARVDIFFWEKGSEQNEGYAQFTMHTNAAAETIPLIKLDGIQDITHSYSLHSPLPSESIQNGCFWQDQVLRVPISNESKLLGLIDIHGTPQHTLKAEEIEFVNTLAQFVAIALENNNFTMGLEQTIRERTRALSEVLAQLESRHQELQRMQTRLIQSEKMSSLGTLVAGLTHEINNPINFIQTGSQNLRGQLQSFQSFIWELTDTSETQVLAIFTERFQGLFGLLQTIQEGTGRVSQLVKDLRIFSRLEEAEYKVINLTEDLDSTVRLLRGQAPQGIEFVTHLEEVPALFCWPAELNQAFMNIILNACRAIEIQQMQAGEDYQGTLRVSLTYDAPLVVVSFADNGCGMTPEVKAKLFEPFFTTEPLKHRGLGMAVVFGIVQKHQGKIQVESTPDLGTQVMLRLPLKLQTPEAS